MADIRYSTQVVDNFDRANENPLASPWVKPSNWDISMRLDGNAVDSPSFDPNNQAFNYYGAESMDGDCEVWARAVTDAPLHDAWYMGLVTADPQNGYSLRNPHNVLSEPFEIWKITGGSGAPIATSAGSHLLGFSDLAMLQISGSTVSGYYSPDNGANWILMVSVTDNTYRTDLYAGLGLQGGGPMWDDFGGVPDPFVPQIYRRPNE